MKIVILDDALEESPIYIACFGASEWNQPRKENVIVTDNPWTYIKEAETADLCYVDPGELGGCRDDMRLRDAHDVLFSFFIEHPNKKLMFIMNIHPTYYKGIVLFGLPNVDWEMSDLARWRIARDIAQVLFKKAPQDLFTKEWTNIQEVQEYLPRLKLRDAKVIYNNLIGSPVTKGMKLQDIREVLSDYYLAVWKKEMHRRGVKGYGT